MIRGLPAAGMFFFSSWLTMIFWGIIASELGGKTISYPMAMLVTISLWLVVGPLFFIMARQRNFQIIRYNANASTYNDQC